MDVLLNTLYILTPGSYLRRDRLNLVIEVEKVVKMRVPIHHVDGVALFGRGMVSPSVMALCQERGVCLTFLSDSGRLMARVDAPRSGNVLVRREQFRRADRPEACLPLARSFVAGKLQNARTTLLRAARESTVVDDRQEFGRAASLIGEHIEALPLAVVLDEVRGHEGDAARIYFGVVPKLVRAARRADFPMNGRSRRPPLDRVNALLSFTYALVLSDCVSGLVAAGLDPDVGFLHADRPGRPSLALDLLEEFRTLVADRLVLALINRQQVSPDQFVTRDGGGIELTDVGRRAVIAAYVARKRETVKHPLLESEVRVGQLPFLQAKVLARHLRGDAEAYLPCILR
ncbi:MAG: type I-C CRISPR-associated endonuclease Cas1c [Isosphaeraceae bacterium]